MMNDPHEIILSIPDAAELTELLRKRSSSQSPAVWAGQLERVLRRATTYAPEHLPVDRAAMGSTVTYLEEPGRIRRSVTLCHPDEADGALDRLSVLSPAGLALLGRRPGSVVMSELHNGWPFTVRVIDSARSAEKELT